MEKKQALSRAGLYAAFILLAGLTAAVYSNTLSAPFIFDDIGNIVQNPGIRGPLLSKNSVIPHPLSGITRRPVAHFTLALNYAAGGLDPSGYHLFNIGVHIIAALFLFGIIRRSLLSPRLSGRFGGRADLLAFFCALLWAMHPLNTQAVTYVIQRCESLMGMFFLGAVYMAVRGFFSERPKKWHAGAVTLFFLGAGVKEVMIATPLFIFLYDVVMTEKRPGEALKKSPGLYSGLALGVVFLVFLAGFGAGRSATGHERTFSALEYLVSQPSAIARYAELSVWPQGLCLDYGWAALPLSKTWPYGLALLALLAATAYALFRRSPVGLPGAWFFLALGPSSSFFPVPDLIFEHRMYLSLAAFTSLFVLGSFRLAGQRGFRMALLACLWAATALALGLSAHHRNRDYATEVGIWADTVQKAPENPRAHANYGMALLNADNPLEAAKALSRSVMLKDDSPGVWYDLGNAWAALKEFEKAKGSYAISLKINPHHPKAWLNLGNVLLKTGDLEKAAQCYKNVLALVPGNEAAKKNLAVALSMMKNGPKQEGAKGGDRKADS
ncbi:MAG: tetratricopeptide repeat protein [Deltaproteobacteria bacterium]|nr:tetratricopeptide repeat protein [Deltaproteobacteria bacterium]